MVADMRPISLLLALLLLALLLLALLAVFTAPAAAQLAENPFLDHDRLRLHGILAFDHGLSLCLRG